MEGAAMDVRAAKRVHSLGTLTRDEVKWRFNNRHNPYIFRHTLQRIVRTPGLEHRELIHGRR